MNNEKLEWRWALVGNIVDKHEYGENHEIRYGARKFRGGTRVVLAPPCWGDGYEQVNVIGLSRYSRKYKKSVIRRNTLLSSLYSAKKPLFTNCNSYIP